MLSTNDSDLRRGVVCALEAEQVSPKLRNRVEGILWQYILKWRGSTEPDELTAVGSAIRKYVATADPSRLGKVGDLLKAGDRGQVPIDIELEVAKMAYRKFEANPPEGHDPEPALARRLGEIATAYLDPSILSKSKNAAVAMLAIQALAVMRSPRAEAVIDQVNASPVAWFRQQLRQRLLQTAALWAHAPAEALRDFSSLIARLQTN